MNTSRSHAPRFYFESGFWRFVLDTKEIPSEQPELRFRQFTDNLGNYVLSGLVLKAGVLLHHQPVSISKLLASYVLIGVGILATFMTELQLFGLCILAFHWFIGVPSSTSGSVRTWDFWWANLRIFAVLIIPTLLLWAMWKFVSSSLWS